MKEEAIDLLIYQLIAQETATNPESLAAAGGFDLPAVNMSLSRLEKNLLIEQADRNARVLNIGESLVKCQARYDESIPNIFENGAIKAKKRE